ncbi:MAG: hypothetical protein CL610_24190 [Anaerolineaceae bacterium]|nr:hypothetical protein [Anaerolineaceae bacterium]
MLKFELNCDSDKTYSGSGQLSFNGSESVDCPLKICQASTGTIFVDLNLTTLELPKEITEIEFVGKTVDDETFTAIGSVIQIIDKISMPGETAVDRELLFRSSGEFHLGIGNKNWQGRATAHFYVTNLEFVGINAEEIAPGLHQHNHIVISVNDTSIIIRQVNNYDERISEIKETHGTAVTAEIVLETTHEAFVKSLELVSTLCHLLSVARGKRINWIYYEVFIDDQKVYTEHQPRIVGRYEGTEVIDNMPPQNTVQFLEECYSHYVRLDHAFKFQNVANFYTAVRSGGFTENRCLTAFALAEYLAKKTSNPPSNKHKRNFRKWLEAIVIEFAVPITGAEIDSFVELRNSLVHELEWMPSDITEQYQSVQHFLDRLLLRILGYKGYYLPATKFPQWSGCNMYKLTPTSHTE